MKPDMEALGIRANEISKAFQYASDNLNRFLFDPEFELKEYRRASYDFKNHTKKELDQTLKQKHRYICNELNAILTCIRAGEVNVID